MNKYTSIQIVPDMFFILFNLRIIRTNATKLSSYE